MAAKTCQICSKPSGMYPLCSDCFALRDEGKIVKCEDCGKWHYADKPCSCEVPEAQVQNDFNSNVTKCIICGEPSDGKHFCKSCYAKYKNKTIAMKITACTQFEIVSSDYIGKRYTCKDGHIVRSKSEREIDNYLFTNGITHAYEKAFIVDDDKSHDLKPDFFMRLKDQDVYLEHFGDGGIGYEEQKKYKIEIYKRKKATIICTSEDDMIDSETSLKRKLEYFEIGKINFYEE